jgi:hypothetical protein
MAANPLGDTLILGKLDAVEGKAVDLPSHEAINTFSNEEHRLAVHDGEVDKKGALDREIKAALPAYDAVEYEKDDDGQNHIIITGADAAAHLLPMRDDFERSINFRGIFLASILSAFQAVMYQIYQAGPSLRRVLIFILCTDLRYSSNLP